MALEKMWPAVQEWFGGAFCRSSRHMPIESYLPKGLKAEYLHFLSGCISKLASDLEALMSPEVVACDGDVQ